MSQPLDMSNDLDAEPMRGYTELESLRSGSDMEEREIPELLAQKTPVRYGIILSCILHVAVFAAVVHVVERGPVRAMLAPGEEVTPVRIVEFQEPKKSVEPPPDKAAALSDRDHAAERNRMPKSLPLGKVAKTFGPENMMAALVPPKAPEEALRPEKPLDEPPEPRTKHDRPKLQSEDRDKPQRDEEQREARETPTREKLRAPSRASDLRPTPEETRRALSGSPGSLFGDLNGDPDEIVVDINTREDKLFSYLLGLKRKIEGVWVYPQMAGQNGIGGMLTVEFVIARDGKLLGVRQLDTSGHKILDLHAVRAIKHAAPYHPFPQRIHAKRLRIRAQFVYATSSFFRRIL